MREVAVSEEGAAAPSSRRSSFLTPIARACAGQGWRAAAHDEWIDVAHNQAVVPEQGWKLHVSASVEAAAAVLARCLPVLAAEPTRFKVAASTERLGDLNLGEGGASQVGKFLTVYPSGDDQAVRLAIALDRATAGLGGPRIPSDRPLRPGSIVHYRYGSFSPRWLQTPLGEVVAAVVGPDGGAEPDRRTRVYAPPAWASAGDPFEAAGVVERLPPTDLIVGGRYLEVKVLGSSPEVTVTLAADLEAGGARVLKRARRHAGATSADAAVARLRHEADVLRRLSAVGAAVPAVHDLIEDGDGVVLVLEHVEGLTIEQCVARARARQGYLADAEITQWVEAAAGVLDRFHQLGMVYGDLKPPHVLIGPHGTVHLVDAESAWPAPAEVATTVAGTAGYASPQRLAGEPPAVTDDVYSMGAVLWLMVTGAEPSHAPDRRNLLARPLHLLRPGASPTLARLIEDCLDPDPARRPQSMPDLVARLGAARPRAATPAPPARPARPAPPAPSFAGLAAALRARICIGFAPDPGSGPPRRDVSGGAAGVLLALAQPPGRQLSPEAGAAIRRGARWLEASPPLPGGPLPGLYVGESGIGLALLRAGQALDDGDLARAGLRRVLDAAQLPHRSPDLYNGTAGRARALLAAWDATGDGRALDAAIEAGDRLLASMQRPEVAWPIPDGYEGASGRSYLGYAHGVAGIADTLLDLHETTADERLAEVVTAAAARLAGLAQPTLAGAEGCDWPEEEGGARFGPVWCHGAAGIARFLLHATTAGLAPDGAVARVLAGALAATAHGARHCGPSQCHGLAGSIEVLLDAWQATGDLRWQATAQDLGHLLAAFAAEPDGLLPPSAGSPPPADLLGGAPGIVCCFARLAEPSLPHVLSRRGLAGAWLVGSDQGCRR